MENELDPAKFYAGATEMPVSQMNVSAMRAMKEVEGQIIMAKKFPRDEVAAVTRIKTSCSRYTLAKSSQYSYPRGGQTISGPSIRLAEVLAQSWGNLDFGIRELSQENGESTVEAYCWDLQTNVRQVKIFQVKHERKAKGRIDKLTDPRDIYELVANNGARRLRACILGIIPSDVVEIAVMECDKTIVGKNDVPLIDRIRSLVDAFAKLSVTKEMIEERLGHKIDVMDVKELLEYGKIFNSLRDGMTKRQDWFAFIKDEKSDEVSQLNEQIGKMSSTGVTVEEAAKSIKEFTAAMPTVEEASKNIEPSLSPKVVEKKEPIKKDAVKKEEAPKPSFKL